MQLMFKEFPAKGAHWAYREYPPQAAREAPASRYRPRPAPQSRCCPAALIPGLRSGGQPRRMRGQAATKLPKVTSAIVAASVAGGVLTLLAAMWRQPGLDRVDERQWIIAAAMGALVLGSWIWPVVVYREGESEAFNMDEAFFVILALLVPPLLTLGTLALATVLAQAARRRPAGQVGLQRRASPDRRGPGHLREPRPRRSDFVPDRGTGRRRRARRARVLRRQHLAAGRRPGLDGHALARAHR